MSAPRGAALRARDEISVPMPVERVYAVLRDLAGYRRWWPRTVRVRALGGEAEEVEVRPFGGPGFVWRLVAEEPPRRLVFQYRGGLVEGQGSWILEPEGSGTRVAYEVDARLPGRPLELLGRVVPFAALHSFQFRRVLRGLVKEVRGG